MRTMIASRPDGPGRFRLQKPRFGEAEADLRRRGDIIWRRQGRRGAASRVTRSLGTRPLPEESAARRSVSRLRVRAKAWPNRAREPGPKFRRIIAAQGLILDHAADLDEPAFEPGAALGRRQGLALRLAQPDEIDERQGLAEHVFDRRGAAAAGEIVRVLAFRQKREAQRAARADQRQGNVDGAIGGLAAGAVAVETEDRLFRHFPEQRALRFGRAPCRAARPYAEIRQPPSR